MGTRETFACALALFALGCGSDSQSGPPLSPGAGGSSGSGGSAGGSAGAGATGGSGGGANDGGGGASGTGGAAASCSEGSVGELWQRIAGTYQFTASMLGAGADAYFTTGSSYEVEVSPASCSLIFHGTGQDFTCTWGNPGEENKAEEDSAAQAFLIMIGAIEQWTSPTPGCQVHGWIDPDRVTGGFLYLPGESTPTTFHHP